MRRLLHVFVLLLHFAGDSAFDRSDFIANCSTDSIADAIAFQQSDRNANIRDDLVTDIVADSSSIRFLLLRAPVVVLLL